MERAVDISVGTEQLIELARAGRLPKDELAKLLAVDQRQPYLDACAAIERQYTEACAATHDPCLEDGCACEGDVCLQPIQRAEGEYLRACGEEWIKRFADPAHRSGAPDCRIPA